MNTHTLTIHSLEGYQAVIEISGNISLHGLAEHIIGTIGFDSDHAFGFYDSPNPYQCSEKYTVFADMGEPEDNEPGVEKTLVSEVFTKEKKMLFLFDYGDEWHFHLLCTKVAPASGNRKVRKVVSETGKRPVQYPDFDDEE